MMAIRSLTHVAAGVLAGAALVGIPTWANAAQNDPAPPSRSDMSSMMANTKSQAQMTESMSKMMDDPKSQAQMTESMSKMMDDPKMRKQMRSIMSGAMGDMSGMSGKKSGHAASGMN